MQILLVDDHKQYATLVQNHLRSRFGFEVEFTADPQHARRLLSDEKFDVVVVDLLHDDLATAYAQRRMAGTISLTRDREFQISGLAILHEMEPQDRPTAVLWTTGDARRELHLLLASQELGIRSFCSKASGDYNLKPLVEAIEAAARRSEHRDQLLDPYLTRPGQRPLAQLLFDNGIWRGIWRALALGARTHKEIAGMLHYAPSTVRNEVGFMADALVELNPGLSINKSKSDVLIGYAEVHWEFFLDDTVMRLFPPPGFRP